ncbi:TraA family conjugative transfer protein [Xanthomonas campestris]|uniref:TraA family conjugative transfer protein n=1 Tax=Xanthomonas campestris pv. papavericola TaxID=487881 RepID=A0AAJ2WZP7_XANCA|nr:TraA family conjugative transfer protein [Xanthomonas campestris]MEC3886297.1 TraA family conjugative transfer protein [Xanthomonas campestris pv. papavericola]
MNNINLDTGAAFVSKPESRAVVFIKDNGLLLLLAAVVVGQALASSGGAATGGAEFQDLYDLVLGWTEGVLGKTIAVSAFLIGMIMGVAKQSIWAFAIGILFAAAFAFGPGIIDGVFTAGFQL